MPLASIVIVLVALILSPVRQAKAETFDVLDLDQNGVLTLSEFRALAKDLARLEQAFNRLDEDQNGLLSRTELGLDGRRLLRRADTNNDGQLSRKELKDFFTNKDGDSIFVQMDEDGDGQLQRHEYFLKEKETKAGVWLPLVKF